MEDVFRFETLHQTISDEFVVFRRAQVAGYVLERHEETGEVSVVVELLNFRERGAVHAVALAEFQQSSGFDRTFEVEMELGHGERTDEAVRPALGDDGHRF
jgi:hypothetical protein